MLQSELKQDSAFAAAHSQPSQSQHWTMVGSNVFVFKKRAVIELLFEKTLNAAADNHSEIRPINYSSVMNRIFIITVYIYKLNDRYINNCVFKNTQNASKIVKQ